MRFFKSGVSIAFILLILSCAEARRNKNAQVAHAMFEAFNEHNWEKMASYYIVDAEFLDPSIGKEYVKQTRAEIVEKYTKLATRFPDIHDEVVGVYEFQDKVIVEFISTGNSLDSLSLNLPICTILTFEDGLIKRGATYYDF